MYSLYSAILAQHFRQLTPVRCAEQTIAQLNQQIFDFSIAEVGDRSFEVKRQVDADSLPCQTNLSDGAIERFLFAPHSKNF